MVLHCRWKNVAMNKLKCEFYRKNWKLGVHLIVGTRYFGVNNQWWSPFPIGQRVMDKADSRIGTVQIHAHYYYRPNERGKNVAMYEGTYTILLDGEQYASAYLEMELMEYCAES